MKVDLHSFCIVEEVEHNDQVYARTDDSELGVSWYLWSDYSCNEMGAQLWDDPDELEEAYQQSKVGYAHQFTLPVNP